MLIGMSNYGKAPDPVLALARDAARTVPGPPMGGAQAFDGSIGSNVEKVYGDLEAKRYP